MPEGGGGRRPTGMHPAGADSAELRRLRRRIDALDRRIVGLLNERARLGLEVGAAKSAAGRRAVLDVEREREVLLRVAMTNPGPLPQADLLAVYRRLILATRRLELTDRGAAATHPPARGTPGDATTDMPPQRATTVQPGDADT